MNRGYYKHYKGGTYDVIGFATHTETNEFFLNKLKNAYKKFSTPTPL